MDKSFVESLSTLSRNGIARCFGPDILDNPERIAESGPARLRLTNKIGQKSLKEIAGALHQFGYIDDPVHWIGRS